MANRKTYDSLDFIKWVSALLIVIIHTNPFHGIEVLNFYIKDVLARIAVPLFFAISGFLFFRRIREWENCEIITEPYISFTIHKASEHYLPWHISFLSAV